MAQNRVIYKTLNVDCLVHEQKSDWRPYSGIILVLEVRKCIPGSGDNWPLRDLCGPSRGFIRVVARLGSISGCCGNSFTGCRDVYNIQQTNKDLRLREQRREKPLAVDELSNVIVPAIQALSGNLEDLDDENLIDWVYVDGPSGYGALGHPSSAMPVNDVAALQRLNEQDRELYQDLVKHDEMIRQMGQLGQEIFEEVQNSVKEQIELAGYSDEDYSQSDKVFVSAMVKRLDEFGDSHEMYDFWEQNRDELIDILDEEAGELVDELEEREREFRKHCENLLEELQVYRGDVQREFGISSEEINESTLFEREFH